MAEAIVSIAPEVRPIEQADPQRLRELDHVAYMNREGLLPDKKDLKRIGQKPGMDLALEQRLKVGLDSANILGVLETARLFSVLDIKVPGQYKSTLPTLIKQCEQHLDTKGISHKPKQRGVVRRRIVKGMAATAGLAASVALVDVAKVGYDFMHGKKPPKITTNVPAVQAAPEAGGAPSTPEPAATPAPEPTATPEPEINDFADVLKPLLDYALKKRAERAKNDPEYSRRVDQELSSQYLTFSLNTYWEEHGAKYEDYRGTITLLSYNIKTGKIASISFSRDIMTPEVTKVKKDKGEQWLPPEPMGNTYKTGGFDLTRLVAERASGLAVDFQILMKDTVVRDVISEITGPIEVDIPVEQRTTPWRIGRKVQDPDGAFIPAGKQTLNAMEAMRLVLAETLNASGKAQERSYRKNLVLKAAKSKIFEKLKAEPKSTGAKLAAFLTTRIARSPLFTQELLADFDWSVFLPVFGPMAKLYQEKGSNIETPDIDPAKEFVFHDLQFGDGGVTRVHNLLDVKSNYDQASPAIQHDLDQARTTREQMTKQGQPPEEIEAYLISHAQLPMAMLIPDGGDPQSSDPISYWTSTRRMVKERLIN